MAPALHIRLFRGISEEMIKYLQENKDYKNQKRGDCKWALITTEAHLVEWQNYQKHYVLSLWPLVFWVEISLIKILALLKLDSILLLTKP